MALIPSTNATLATTAGPIALGALSQFGPYSNIVPPWFVPAYAAVNRMTSVPDSHPHVRAGGARSMSHALYNLYSDGYQSLYNLVQSLGGPESVVRAIEDVSPHYGSIARQAMTRGVKFPEHPIIARIMASSPSPRAMTALNRPLPLLITSPSVRRLDYLPRIPQYRFSQPRTRYLGIRGRFRRAARYPRRTRFRRPLRGSRRFGYRFNRVPYKRLRIRRSTPGFLPYRSFQLPNRIVKSSSRRPPSYPTAGSAKPRGRTAGISDPSPLPPSRVLGKDRPPRSTFDSFVYGSRGNHVSSSLFNAYDHDSPLQRQLRDTANVYAYGAP